MARRAATKKTAHPDGTVVLDLGTTLERIVYADTVGIHGVSDLAIKGPCTIQISTGQNDGWRVNFKEDGSLQIMWTGFGGLVIQPEVSNHIILIPRSR